MKEMVILCYFIFAEIIYINGQEWCKPVKSFEPDKFFSSMDKLSNDRFCHTISPVITKYGHTQIESVLFLRDQYYADHQLNEDHTSSTLNAYSGLKIKRALPGNLEMDLSLTDIIVKTGKEISEYGGPNLMSRFSVGSKYSLSNSGNRNAKLAFSGRVSIPLHDTLKTNLISEARILCSISISRYLQLTGNLGGANINKTNNTLIYAFEMKWITFKRLELITEFYDNYINAISLNNPNNRWLAGIGYYARENFYLYSTFEHGLHSEDMLNKGRVDMGLAYRF